MTDFASLVHDYIQTERAVITAAQLTADFTLYRRAWAAEERARIPEKVGSAVIIALLELLVLGRVKEEDGGYRWVPEPVKQELQGRMF